MSETANTFTSIQPMLHEAYADGVGSHNHKNKFKKIKSKLLKKDCGCKYKSEEKCSCKKG
jgi:hypothetical protein